MIGITYIFKDWGTDFIQYTHSTTFPDNTSHKEIMKYGEFLAHDLEMRHPEATWNLIVNYKVMWRN